MAASIKARAVITADNKLKPGLTAAAQELDRFRARQTHANAAFGSTVSRALGAVGGAFVAMDGARRAFRSSLSLEREMYNIQRATDSSGEVLKRQESFILDLARATGKTKEELAQLYAAAGFAGRPASELGRFTDYAAKATVAWGTSAQETGQALAEIGNIYGANQKRIEAIGDAINTVADGSASSEKDLIEITRRVGGAANGIGISAENLLGFAAALKEVGVGTEVVATGLNAMMTKISVPDDKFDKALKTVGLVPKAFRDSVDKNATGSILTLLEALKKLEGTKRIAVLKDMFGMEYADDISRLVGSLDRVQKLIGLANDKAKSLGSVRAGFGLALEKDFNRVDRATQALDVLMVRLGNRMKEIGGGFAEVINQSVDASERAADRLDGLRKIDADAEKRAGKKDPPKPKPEDPRAKDRQTLADIAGGKFDESSLPYVIGHAENPEVRKAAEDKYRELRYAKVDAKDIADEQRLRALHKALTGRSPLANPNRLDQRRATAALDAAEAIRKRRMEREFDDMAVVPAARADAAKKRTGIDSLQRLGSFGDMPIVIPGKGKNAAPTTFQPPKLDLPKPDLRPGAGDRFAPPAIGDRTREAATVDLTAQGTSAGSQFVAGLNAELDRGIAEAEAKIGRLKALLSFTATPTVRVNVSSSGGLGHGLPTGQGMPEVR
ncbi:MAG: phage tail tape measure protein [Beijerinckiaceae bacterium]|nr:phage tail tape measure protein [Beijerinckiaceae bacterium]